MFRRSVLIAASLFSLSACEGFDAAGKWHDGIPTTSGYYVNPVASCIHVGQVNNGMSGYHAGVLVGRVDSGERMCDGSEIYEKMARHIVKNDVPAPRNWIRREDPLGME